MKHPTSLLSALFCLVCLLANAQDYSHKQNKAFLGVNFDDISNTKAELLGFDNPHGAYITSVVENTAADKAGLKAFDYLYAIGDHTMSSSVDLGDILDEFSPGDKTKAHFFRNGKKQSTSIVLGNYADSKYGKKRSEKKPFLGVNKHRDHRNDELGVKVTINSNSTASEMGLKDGDVIMALNGYTMVDWDDISSAINTMEVGQKVVVDYQRDGQTQRGQLPIRSYKESHKYAVVSSKMGASAFLGINSNSVSKEKAQKLSFENPYGSYVSSVIANTAAKKAGIQPFDYIYGIDDYTANESFRLTGILRKFKPSDKVNVHIIRNGQKQTISLELGEHSDAKYQNKEKCEAAFLGVKNRKNMTDLDGVQVDIVSNSSAAAIQMKDGDLIQSINGYKILDWQDVSAAIGTMKAGDVSFFRDGASQTASGTIKSHCDTKDEDSYGSTNAPEADNWDGGEKVDFDAVAVELENLSDDEASNFNNQYGLEMTVQNSLSVNDLQVNPNPSIGMFSLQFRLPQSGPTVIHVFNAMGRLIYEYDLGEFTGPFSDEIDISQNGTGNYFMNIKQGSQSYSTKIVLQVK